MKKSQLIFFLLFIPLILNSYIFEVDKFESLIFITSALTVDLSNNYCDRQLIEAPTNSELEALNKDEVPFFDRIGLQSYSATLKDFSDYSAYLAIGSTLYCLYENDKEVLLNNLIVFSEIIIAQIAIAKWTKTL